MAADRSRKVREADLKISYVDEVPQPRYGGRLYAKILQDFVRSNRKIMKIDLEDQSMALRVYVGLSQAAVRLGLDMDVHKRDTAVYVSKDGIEKEE